MENGLELFIKWINYPFVHIGNSAVTASGVFVSLMIVCVAVIVSGILQRIVETGLEKKFNLEQGLIYTIKRFLHYSIIILGVIVAAQTIGLNLGSLAVIFGFLSVGIGFGLQNITSNFISGLILLLERPVSVGDLIEVESRVGKVLKISMRSTIVMTLDNVAIIVPNSQLIESQVINWSMEDPRLRIHCPVGVAYGSDIPKVKEALFSVALNHPDVLKEPAPQVRFLEFGDSSLNFDLLIWIGNPVKKELIQSEINYAIDEAFRKAAITIPFPQRDVHVQTTPAITGSSQRI
jgi:small-conductance mechanosensitive channel